jgi:nitrile hydratase subunit beta
MMSESPFAHGQKVVVRDDDPPFHHRTPWYVKGKVGEIDEVYDPWPNPEKMAYGVIDGKRIRLYRVEFDQRDLWPDYEGPERDKLVLDLFEHWLAPTDGSTR